MSIEPDSQNARSTAEVMNPADRVKEIAVNGYKKRIIDVLIRSVVD